MDFHYIITNTLIYGYISLLISSVFLFKKYINFALGTYFVLFGYLLYSIQNGGLTINSLLLLLLTLFMYFGVDFFVVKSFTDSKKREVFSIVFSLGLLIFIENVLFFTQGGTIISIKDFSFTSLEIIIIFILVNSFLIYVLKCSFIGKFYLANSENGNISKSIGVYSYKSLTPYFMVLLLFGFIISYIQLTENSLRPSDGVFFLLKGVGIMVLVGLRNLQYIFLGSLLYVTIEYYFFIHLGVSINHKESLILIVILLILLFKKEGIFSFNLRQI